jgi:hypothetical protein
MIRSDVGAMPPKVCYWRQPGKHLLFAGISHFDTNRTSIRLRFSTLNTEDFSFRSTNATPAKVSTIARDPDLVPDISARMIWLHCGIVSRLAAMERIRWRKDWRAAVMKAR